MSFCIDRSFTSLDSTYIRNSGGFSGPKLLQDQLDGWIYQLHQSGRVHGISVDH